MLQSQLNSLSVIIRCVCIIKKLPVQITERIGNAAVISVTRTGIKHCFNAFRSPVCFKTKPAV